MPIPAYPENREEQYLNRIATGEGDIPAYPENRTEQYLDAIANNGGGGGSGSGLPEVSAEDNGDVLTVVDGAWAKAAPSGGGGVLVVNVDWDVADGTLDKTWQEIYDADWAVLTTTPSGSIPQKLYADAFIPAPGAFYVRFVYTTMSGSPACEFFVADSPSGYPVWTEDPYQN